MEHRYAIHILEQGQPKVTEQDIEIALERQGIDLSPADTSLDQIEANHFVLEIPIRVKVRQLKRELEALDGYSKCRVKVEQL